MTWTLASRLGLVQVLSKHLLNDGLNEDFHDKELVALLGRQNNTCAENTRHS